MVLAAEGSARAGDAGVQCKEASRLKISLKRYTDYGDWSWERVGRASSTQFEHGGCDLAIASRKAD